MDVLIAGVPGLVIVEIVVKIAKATGLKSRYIPLFSVAIGVIVTVVAKLTNLIGDEWTSVIIGGVFLGAATAGLYDVTKKSILNK